MPVIYPDDLPCILYYRVGNTVRVTLPRHLVKYISSSGCTNAAQICPTIPYGADAWQIAGGKWRPLNCLPAHWLPFLNRERGTELDPRPKQEGKRNDRM